MENPFQYINKPLKEVPEDLKAKVMNDVAVAKLFMELASLFSFDLAKVIEYTVKQRKK
ncbi:hypothetical protein [Aestuariibaculum sediminum]|uniref:Uncharacterized protein n=1 Tax=Aestuariibaculum sediminum TaxID=2770637 RepID=A0A8J6U806_9FLAO|nr:hypothetical protein [Aestuariibaculum sediminum]MBD0832708.1 hypothetical protein [Aestuariibaculum sediminum]